MAKPKKNKSAPTSEPSKSKHTNTASQTTSQAGKKRLYQFIGLFLGLLLLGSVIYPFASVWLNNEILSFMKFTASVCGGILAAFSNDVTQNGRFVTIYGFTVEIIEECTGIMEMLIFLAALLAYPTSWKSKAIGAFTGIPILYLFNILRIVFLTVVGAYYHNLFKFMHLFFWQATLILMITTVWVLWILLVVNRDKKAGSIFT
ncbi:MAG: exosortase H [candidate division Zixibacteria bacterium]|nr:exosortase H [candidate division Zixibacteria bacterium]